MNVWDDIFRLDYIQRIINIQINEYIRLQYMKKSESE